MATVELITKNAQGALVRTVVGLPVGAVFWTAAKTPPPHSLAADGAAVSRPPSVCCHALFTSKGAKP